MQKKKKKHLEKCYFVFDFTYITHIIVYNHQILCKCIISYHTIAVRSSKLLFLFYVKCCWIHIKKNQFYTPFSITRSKGKLHKK